MIAKPVNSGRMWRLLIKRVLIAAIVPAILCGALYFYTIIALRLSSQMLLTTFSVQIENPTQTFYVRMPYANYVFSYHSLPGLEGWFPYGAKNSSDFHCRTIVEKDGKVVLDTTQFDSGWHEESGEGPMVKITCQVVNPNKHPLYITVTPGF